MASGRLTTHVLDTAHGKPGAGIRIELFAVGEGAPRLIVSAVTNLDGRTDAPLLTGDAMKPGRYEIVFHIGAYFSGAGVAVPDPPFLDTVPIRFAIANAAAHYHIPLLASPWSYTTYRGS